MNNSNPTAAMLWEEAAAHAERRIEMNERKVSDLLAQIAGDRELRDRALAKAHGQARSNAVKGTDNE